VGVGELLARLEALKTMLAAEGLFASENKVALPLLPRKIGLICGRNTDAERDVVENAKRRWPAVQFEIREVTVQGAAAVSEVSAALAELESLADVDVIIITRGGGSFEDLLPFSDEGLVRLAAKCSTPIVSAIGHEKDSPLLDLVADFRASTPTDAAKRVVPDINEEIDLIEKLRDRASRFMRNMIELENSKIAKVLFDNLRKMHTDLTSRIFESVTGNNERCTVKTKTINSFDEKQFITQTYNISPKSTKYKILKDTSVENYTKMSQEMNELENMYEKHPDKILHTKIKILQTKLNRQKKRILAVSNKN
jgi:exodeoxyribonuclease VII large subunit